MIDVFNDILKAYKTALTGLSVPAYAAVIPHEAPKTYVIYQPVFEIAKEAKTCSGQDATMQVSIITMNATGSFSDVNGIAAEVFARIYPEPRAKLPGTKNIGTEKSQDRMVALPLFPDVQIQRIIHFTHKF